MEVGPRVFVSYSWDSDDHKTWVRELASRLRKNGVNARLDQWHISPGESLTRFMEQEIPASDRVLVICTPMYAAKSQARTGGVGYEQQIISGEIAAGIPRRKFVPVLRAGTFEPGPNCAIPAHFGGIYTLDMSSPEAEEKSIESLLRELFDEPANPAPGIGEPPKFDQPDLGGRVLRLPSLEIEGWELESGVVRNEVSPKTFLIPTEDERSTLAPGDLVKIAFSIADEDESGAAGISGERMWVRLTGRSGPYYLGSLANNPATFSYVDPDNEDHYVIADDAPLKFGSEVVFLPEHVIDLIRVADQDQD